MMEFAVKEQQNSLNKILFCIYAFTLVSKQPNLCTHLQAKVGAQLFPWQVFPH